MSTFIKTFIEIADNALGEVGGKGANLAALTAAGFAVPTGFCITTQAYREFLTHYDLETQIAAKLAEAEDLPDLSFAGQHDTSLNVSWENEVL